MDPGKLFIGGISWDTNVERLREYFQTFGDVIEAVIMKDRATGRARGFGFVIYADPAVADRVVKQKHMIDGRTVEAKKAVPRDDQNIQTRNHGTPSASPVPTRTKKIFVGGLASTVTEGDFKRYFEQFGTITDVVVMYDHNTQRPRGFGFITFDSEDAVERALINTFHDLNGKTVEVKRAVPKELSPVPNRSPLGGGSSGLSRVNSFLNGYTQSYSPIPMGGHGVTIDDRQSPMPFTRGGYPSFSPSSYGNALNYEPRMSPNFGETANIFPKLSFEQGLCAMPNSNVNRHDNFADFDGVNRGNVSTLGSSSWSLWGNGSINETGFPGNNAPTSLRNIEANALTNSESIWNPPAIPAQGGGRASVSNGLGLGYARENNNVGSDVRLYGRDMRNRTLHVSSFPSLDGGFDAKFDDFLGGGSDQSLHLPSLGLKGSGSFEFGLGNSVSDVPLNNPAGLCW
ncbi:heterogeneous nuclear ribonucleoprotein 1-like [Amaranthus tricolor]|uniref:heterogeneous nuclear ribonucleoprotein 1-like n=1 Tax=Amaranthus tricolor TaxID=29722 RepID=UPI002586DF90|nr:heterogeneous nuclear ribonucleoprotein 1-like [Amaranthus tricolor]XP_057537545.1 heterogeneous nuclear ribonucleoprotein 1-like [Amaranthus tricolor]